MRSVLTRSKRAMSAGSGSVLSVIGFQQMADVRLVGEFVREGAEVLDRHGINKGKIQEIRPPVVDPLTAMPRNIRIIARKSVDMKGWIALARDHVVKSSRLERDGEKFLERRHDSPEI